jgi:hypothetical protein
MFNNRTNANLLTMYVAVLTVITSERLKHVNLLAEDFSEFISAVGYIAVKLCTSLGPSSLSLF